MSFESGTPPNQSPATPAAPEPFDPGQPASFPMQPVVPAPAVPVPTPIPLVKPRSSGRFLNAILAIAAVVAIGGVAFAVGRTTAPAAATSGQGTFGAGDFLGPGASFEPGASGAPGFLGGGQGGLGLRGGITVTGTVQSVSDDTLTIETEAGQTVELNLNSDTTYHRKTDGAAADVTTGSTVEVQLDFAGGVGRPTASADTSGPVGTASSVTVVP
ncbi:MAG TPA: hypothetical protein VFW02_06350 [Candidatus Limnocylindrales bacterium]|nr:hypothetical protein [Candidatus Limnocylindrales bacterium]